MLETENIIKIKPFATSKVFKRSYISYKNKQESIMINVKLFLYNFEVKL